MVKRNGLLKALFLCLALALPATAGPGSLGCEACERWVDGAECTRDGPKFWANCAPERFCWCYPENECYCQWDCGRDRCYQI